MRRLAHVHEEESIKKMTLIAIKENLLSLGHANITQAAESEDIGPLVTELLSLHWCWDDYKSVLDIHIPFKGGQLRK